MNNQILVLLSTYNGSKYIKEQIDSLNRQRYKNIKIKVKDDNSTDKTVEILKSYENIELMGTSKNIGAKRSFAALLKYTVENSDAQYFMFCDQDDVWKNDKVEKTLSKMQELEKEFGNIPILVHTDLEVVDEKLNYINTSFMDFQNLDFSKNQLQNLLMQNNITGCTVMINRKLAEKSLPMPKDMMMHDWWLGLVASKFGKIGYLPEPTIKYRQHSSNAVGAKGFDVRFVLKSLFKKITLSGNINQAKAFLKQFENELGVETKKMLQEFTTLEEKSFWQKRAVLWKYKLLKQGFIRNVGLFLKI